MIDRSPIGWAVQPLKKYAVFSGRAPRAELWWFTLFMAIAYIGMWILLIGSIGSLAMAGSGASAGFLGAVGIGMMVMGLFWLVILIPMIAVQVRRLHDTNRSGWWLGGFYLLYALYFAASLGVGLSAAESGDPSAAGGVFAGVAALGLLLFVYFVVLLVFYCLEGTRGANDYGPDPYGADIAEVFA